MYNTLDIVWNEGGGEGGGGGGRWLPRIPGDLYLPEKNGPTRIPAPDHKLVQDQAMSMGSSVTSPDAAYV